MIKSRSRRDIANNPRDGNTGVQIPAPSTKALVSHCLDWLQYSCNWPAGVVVFPASPEQQASILAGCLPRSDALFFTGEVLDPMHGYTDAAGLSHGRASWHKIRPEQKIGVMFAGRDLGALRVAGLPDLHLLTFALDRAAKIARLDFAVDIYDPRARVNDMLDAFKAGDVMTRSRSIVPIATMTRTDTGRIDSADTVYFGKRTSDTFMRIYDKAAEQGVSGTWVRCEIVFKNENAWAMAQDMRQHGIGEAGKMAMLRHLNAPGVAWYDDALRGDSVELTPKLKPETDTIKWLKLQVAPVLKRELLATTNDGDWSLYDMFREVLDIPLRTR